MADNLTFTQIKMFWYQIYFFVPKISKFFWIVDYSPETWLDADNTGHGIIWLWNAWQQEGLAYDHARIKNVIETFK